MEQIASLRSAWLFDSKGNVKQIKNQSDRLKSKEIYQRAREALRYTRSVINDTPFKRLSFINGKEEWTVTITAQNEIIVMHKDEALALA